MGLAFFTSSKVSEGFLEIYIMRALSYHSFTMNCSVDSPTLLPVPSSSSIKESISLPCLLFMEGEISLGLLASIFSAYSPVSHLAILCSGLCVGQECTIETIFVPLFGEGWCATSQHKMIKFQLSEFVVKAL